MKKCVQKDSTFIMMVCMVWFYFFSICFLKKKESAVLTKAMYTSKLNSLLLWDLKATYIFFLNIELKTPIITKTLLLFYFNWFLVYVERRTFYSLSVLLMSRNFQSLTLHRQQVKTNQVVITSSTFLPGWL